MKNKIKKSIPNIITFTRVLSLVLGFIYFLNGNYLVSICLYIYGSVSDAFDGYLARKWNAYTRLGSYLDAVSDKFYALSIIILSIINGNYYIISVAVLELVITIVNYKSLRKNGTTNTVRVGKFKMTFEFLTLLSALIGIKIKKFYYLFFITLIFTIYFGIQSINAYINQKNNKEQKLIIDEKDYKGKNYLQKTKLLLKEFKYYLLNPVKIIK